MNPLDWLEIATDIQAGADLIGLGISRHQSVFRDSQAQSLVHLFDEMVTSQDLVDATRQLFVDGHYANAVEDAFKCLNNSVKEKSRISDDGDSLMRRAFSAKSPILKLNPFQSESDRNEQRGYMDIFAGAMTGIRNPRAHEHEIADDPETALEMLIIANHLMRKLEHSTLASSDDSQ